MQLPKLFTDLISPKLDPNTPPEIIKKKKQQRLLFLSVGITLTFLVIFLLLILSLGSNKTTDPKTPIGENDPQKALEKSQKEKEEASQSAAEAAKPLNRLQKVFDEVIGSNSLKKKLAFEETTALATIDYVISSNDGTFIIKTSYENFADLAVKVFNISEVQKLSVSSYATKFVDQYGQPNQVALKLEITRETNDKVNWAVKKYSYKDYPSILTTHILSPSLDKEYKALVKTL